MNGFPELSHKVEFNAKPKHRKFPTYDGANPQTNEDKLTLYMQLKVKCAVVIDIYSFFY